MIDEFNNLDENKLKFNINTNEFVLNIEFLDCYMKNPNDKEFI